MVIKFVLAFGIFKVAHCGFKVGHFVTMLATAELMWKTYVPQKQLSATSNNLNSELLK